MTRFYGAFGALVLAAFAWMQFSGWSLTDPSERKTGPRSLRESPGSSRPHYTGAK
jgi:hypothetical protein